MQELSPEALIEALAAEAAYEDSRRALSEARTRRARALYAGWRELKDTTAVARAVPVRGITAATVRSAVKLLAPPADFEQLSLLDVAAAQ
jgi:hypothetical protein